MGVSFTQLRGPNISARFPRSYQWVARVSYPAGDGFAATAWSAPVFSAAASPGSLAFLFYYISITITISHLYAYNTILALYDIIVLTTCYVKSYSLILLPRFLFLQPLRASLSGRGSALATSMPVLLQVTILILILILN